jgi:glycogen operon protein
MLLAGDEIGRTQFGNNNAYNQDSEISWTEWDSIRPADARLREFVRRLIALRRRHRVFSRPRFFRGEAVSAEGLKDITWLTPQGREPPAEDCNNPFARSIGYVLGGAAGEFYTPGGQRDVDESFLVLLNAYHEDLDFRIPQLPTPMRWRHCIDTAEDSGSAAEERIYEPGSVFCLRARSFSLFIHTVTEAAPPDPTGILHHEEPPAVPPTATTPNPDSGPAAEPSEP